MKSALRSRLALGLVLLTYPSIYLAAAQEKPQVPDSEVVRKSIKSVGYEVGGGSTKVVLVATSAAPNASG